VIETYYIKYDIVLVAI